MQASIGWIDFLSLDHDRVKSVLNLLADPGMVDELGIGSIRDSFSDSLFPSISTIQIRAKYFLTVPRIIRNFKLMADSKQRRTGGITILRVKRIAMQGCSPSCWMTFPKKKETVLA